MWEISQYKKKQCHSKWDLDVKIRAIISLRTGIFFFQYRFSISHQTGNIPIIIDEGILVSFLSMFALTVLLPTMCLWSSQNSLPFKVFSAIHWSNLSTTSDTVKVDISGTILKWSWGSHPRGAAFTFVSWTSDWAKPLNWAKLQLFYKQLL